jgi:hypothetical protein
VVLVRKIIDRGMKMKRSVIGMRKKDEVFLLFYSLFFVRWEGG